MISILKVILSAVSYERRNIHFYKNIFNLREIILLIILFTIAFFLTIASYQSFENDWIFMNHDFFS